MTTTCVNATTDNAVRAAGIRLFEQWTHIWNGELPLAGRILAPGFRIHFGSVSKLADTDALRGPDGLTGFVAAHREAIPGLVYAMDGVPVVDTVTGHVASRWTVTVPEGTDGATVTKSGIDILAVTGDRITEVWSVTGSRVFPS